jgi:feruloyl-CoA synthase
MVQDGPTFERALKALDLDGVTVIHVARPCEASTASPSPSLRQRL